MENFIGLPSDHIITEQDVENITELAFGFKGFKVSSLVGLNKQQAGVVLDIIDYLNNDFDLRSYYTVQGNPGVGKTYTIKRAISHLFKNTVIAATPSHFAKNILQQHMGDSARVITVASLLGMRVSYDDDGNEILIRNIRVPKPPIEYYNVVVIDEVSMIDDVQAAIILEATANKKLIVLGDYAQLPPVGQSHDAKFFNKIDTELTVSMRFSGAIGDLANSVRDEIDKIKDGFPPNLNVINAVTDRVSKIGPDGSGYIFLNSRRTMLRAVIRRFKMGKGVNYIRVVAYRNKTIDMLNNIIRIGLYGHDSKQFEKGEILINKGGYSIDDGRYKKLLISNGEVFIVESSKEVEGPYSIPCIELKFEGKIFESPIIVLTKEGKEIYDRILKRLTKIAKNDRQYWDDVKDFKDAFATFNYHYCCSSHKAQGSSIQYVFVVEDDILSVKPTTLKEKLQSLNVAITRASFRLYVFNKNFATSNEGLNPDYLKLEPDE